MEVVPLPVQDANGIERPVTMFAEAGGGALITMPGSFTVVARDQVVQVANHCRLPSIYPLRLFVSCGGLMSYGTDTTDQYRQAVTYVTAY